MSTSARCLFLALACACLTVTTILSGCGGGGSPQASQSSPPTLVLSGSPASLTVYAATTFTFMVNATVTGTSATPTVNLGSLPAGLTSSTQFPLSVPASGAPITLVADKSLAAGSYSISISGTAGSASGSTSITAKVPAGAPPVFGFTDPNAASGFSSEVTVAPGSSASLNFNSFTNNQVQADYNVQLSADGLPAGTTATFSPGSTIFPGQSVTVTISAAANAPASQNNTITVVGTPQAPVANASVQFLLTVTQGSGQAPNNRTDYLSLKGSPNSAVYDPAHNVIYASNPSWNRIDVISNATHTIVRTIPVPAPASVDITQDGTKVWVATASQRVYAINTATYAAIAYVLPEFTEYSNVGPDHWRGLRIISLSDGTVMLILTTRSAGYSSDGGQVAALWNPASNTLTGIQPPGGGTFPAMWELVIRSGDGTKVYSIGEDSGGESFSYDVASKAVSPPVQLGGYAVSAAVNRDGSRVAVEDANGLRMLSGMLSPLGNLPGGGIGPGFHGGMAFSQDSTTLYEEAMPTDIPFIIAIDATSLEARSIAPAMPMIPVMTEMTPPFYIPQPFAVDSTGMVLGLQDWGIAFDDATFAQNYAVGQPGSFTLMQHMSPYSGPVGGGTASSGFGNAVTATPNVWYGNNQGTATSNGGTLSLTSPPAQAGGPVNLKMLFPDGVEVFDPLFFAYGTVPEYAILSGASPNGGVSGEISGYGLPANPSGGTLTVGGNAATVTTQTSQYLPFTAAPFPETFLNFTIPPGPPGWADVSVTTPSGTGVLPKSIFYAQSVNDYASTDQFQSVVYDLNRQQLYLSTKGQIDVFSLSSNQFVTPFSPPAQGTQKTFAGMALTPDGLLLAADQADGSLAVIDPDNPAGAFAIPIAAVTTQNSCSIGPLYVAAAANQQAFVVTGALPGNSCGPGGVVYRVNLSTKTAAVNQNGLCGGGNVMSSHDGNFVALGMNPQGYGGLCIYAAATNTYYEADDDRVSAAISADGNVVAAGTMLDDAQGNTVGWMAQPAPYYQTAPTAIYSLYTPLLQPKINDSGSLYYIPAANLVDIVDVQHGLTKMRFSLKETVQNTASPMAIDSGGRHMYLITQAGLTIVDLGAAPLSIGSLSPTSAGAGLQVTVRGSGFASGMSATVGGQPASVSVTDENTLVLIMPALTPGPQDIVLQLPDGESYTFENAITIP